MNGPRTCCVLLFITIAALYAGIYMDVWKLMEAKHYTNKIY